MTLGYQRIRLRFIFKVVNGATPKSTELEYWDGQIAWVTPDDLGSLKGDTILKTARNISDEGLASCGTSLVPKHSLILSTRAPIGYVALAGKSLCTNQGCRSLVLKGYDHSRFFYYQILILKRELQSLGQGSTFNELAGTKLKDIWLVQPNFDNQKLITQFLDHKTALIDQYIANKLRQIELLDKLRISIISEAVTQGLNPDVAMKNSGVEWLDKVPKHWEYRRLKFTASLNNDVLSENTNPLYEIEYVDIGSVTYEHGITSTEKLYFSDAPSRARRLVQDGDTIISTVRTYLKAIACIKKPPNNLIVSTGFAVIRPKKNICPSFLGYFLQSKEFVDSVMANSDGVSYPAINSSRLAALPVFLPGLIEQQAIAQFLDHKATQIDQSIYQLKEQITKMEAYRTSLISEAVTGKIDVRDFKLPATEVTA